MRCRLTSSVGRSIAIILPLAFCALFSGCLVPSSRVATYRQQYQRLCEKNKALETRLLSLDAHSRKLEGQLTRAEDELAALDHRGRADRRRLNNYEAERDAIYGRLGQGSIPPSVSGQLAELARRYPSIHYDDRTGVAKLDADVLFDTAQADLRSNAKDILAEFATIMRGPDAHAMRMMVVGHTDDRRVEGAAARNVYPNNWHLGSARALAVVDYLRVRGVGEDRMGMASYGKFQPVVANSSEPNRQRNRRVELFLIAADVPVVGWTETMPGVYR